MTGHAERFRSTFARDANGCGRSLATTGYGYEGELRRVPDADLLPIERLYAGDAADAARELVTAVPLERAMAIAGSLLRRPTHAGRAVAFLRAAVARHPTSAGLRAMLGDALVLAGDRKAAVAEYGKALATDGQNAAAAMGFRMLGHPAPPAVPGAGWRLPISLADLFTPFTSAEIESVERAWRRRDLAPRDVRLVRRDTRSAGAGAAPSSSSRASGSPRSTAPSPGRPRPNGCG